MRPSPRRVRLRPWTLAVALIATFDPRAALAEGAPDTTGATPGVGARATRTTGALVRDLGTVASSPARMKRGDALWAAGTLIATAALVANDEALHEAFARQRGDDVYDAVRDLGGRIEPAGQMVSTLPYWMGLAALSSVFKARPVQGLCLDVLESHLIAGALRNSAKFVAGRERPGPDGPYRFWKYGTSFPSGHASVAFELATIFTRRTRERSWAVRVPVAAASYGLAACLAVERVDSDAHWPSDVFVGAVSGSVIAATVASRNEARRDGVAPRWGVAPTPTGAAVTVRF